MESQQLQITNSDLPFIPARARFCHHNSSIPVCRLITASVRSSAAARLEGEPGAFPEEEAASCSGTLLKGEPPGGHEAAVPCQG